MNILSPVSRGTSTLLPRCAGRKYEDQAGSGFLFLIPRVSLGLFLGTLLETRGLQFCLLGFLCKPISRNADQGADQQVNTTQEYTLLTTSHGKLLYQKTASTYKNCIGHLKHGGDGNVNASLLAGGHGPSGWWRGGCRQQ